MVLKYTNDQCFSLKKNEIKQLNCNNSIAKKVVKLNWTLALDISGKGDGWDDIIFC